MSDARRLGSDDLAMIVDSLSSWIGREYSFAQRQRRPAAAGRDRWSEMAELGWLGLGISEEYGGIGGSSEDVLETAELFGRCLLLEPYFSTVVLGAGLIDRFATDAQKADLLPEIAAGRLKLAFAYSEPEPGFALDGIWTTAVPAAGGWAIEGQKAVVYDAPVADRLLVLAVRNPVPGEFGLFLVDPGSAGVEISAYPTIDGKPAAEIVLTGAPALEIGCSAIPAASIASAIEEGTIYLCREALGIAQQLYDQTLSHLRTRRQFGKALGEFQVLQHRMVDMLIRLECFRSLVMACSAVHATALDRSRSVAAAKFYVGHAALWIARQSVQLHGGMGVSEEMVVGQYLRRLMAIEASFGNSDEQLRRFADLGKGADAEGCSGIAEEKLQNGTECHSGMQ